MCLKKECRYMFNKCAFKSKLQRHNDFKPYPIKIEWAIPVDTSRETIN